MLEIAEKKEGLIRPQNKIAQNQDKRNLARENTIQTEVKDKDLKNTKEKLNAKPQEFAKMESSKNHRREEANNLYDGLRKILDTVTVKVGLPLIGNSASLIFNAISAYSNAFSKDTQFKELASKLGSIGTKIFFITNGTINFLEQLIFRNYTSAFGNFFDNIVAAFVKQEQTYLARGISLGFYTIANSLGILNNRKSFKSFGDHFNHIVDGLKKSYKMLTTDPIKHLKSSSTGLLGTVGGFLSLIGTTAWKITGSEKLGAGIRDFGGLLIDFEQAKPSNIKEGKPFYFAAGSTYIFGTICDYLSKLLPQQKSILVPLGFATDVIARNFLRISQLYEIGESPKTTVQHQ